MIQFHMAAQLGELDTLTDWIKEKSVDPCFTDAVS